VNDHLGIFDQGPPPDDEDVDVEALRHVLNRESDARRPTSRPSRRHEARERQQAEKRRRRRRRRHTVVAVLVLALLGAGLYAGFRIWRHDADVHPDFSGAGDSEVVVRVQSSDSLDDIAQTLVDNQVIADAQTFVDLTRGDAELAALQPGYYRVRQHASSAAAADALVDKDNRVGRVDLIPGHQLADITARSTTGASTTIPGYITQITEAACVPVNGKSDCFTTDELWKVAENTLPSALGVVDWAESDIEKAPDRSRRLEGMILPGTYDVPPNSGPTEALKAVVSASSALWNSSEIVADAKQVGKTPYQVAVIASIVQREAVTADMPKVARVIYNRLARGMPLQMDSTVNYALDQAQISTSAADRKNPSPYNTYMHRGLPPTPISSPGKAALDAAVNPAEGGWLYFVAVDLKGNSCFSITDAEHAACVALARKNGVFG
jgi:UPF0755 protein